MVDYPDGRLAIRYREVELAYRTFDKFARFSQATIVDNKHLDAARFHPREAAASRI